MKLFLILGLVAFLSPAIHAKTLIPAKIIKIVSPDHSKNVSTFSVRLSVRCSRGSIIDSHNTKSCGESLTKLAVAEDGTIQIPEIPFFRKSLSSQNINNYEISIAIHENQGTDNQILISSISLDKPKEFEHFSKTNIEFNIVTIKGVTFDVLLNGKNFFGSAESQNEKAQLFLLIDSDQNKKEDGMLLECTHFSNLQSNQWAKNGLLLKDSKEIFIPEMTHVYLKGDENKSLNIYLNYSLENDYSETHDKAVRVKLLPSQLSEVQTLKLE